MVEALEQRVQNAGLENVTCEQADIYALPYQADEFDAVVAANVLHLVPDLPAALDALRHVLKPGGSLVVPTFCHDETKVSWLISRLLAVSGFPGHRRFTMQSLRHALEENGIQVVSAELLTGLIPIGFVEGDF
jgi:ubiquinone/menaquinone biosynthesis C-methylase UbiE